jgi:hypothetical protein
MANKFNVDEAPELEPASLVIGDFVQWKRSDLVNDYPTAEYSAEYIARIDAGGSSEVKIAATESTNYYLFTVASTDSASYDAGMYNWQLEITQTSTGNRVVVDRGHFEILVDLDANNVDPRTHAEIMVAKIESLLQGKADSDVSNYSIGNRSLTKLSFEELMNAREYYQREVVRHMNEEKVRHGKTGSSTIRVRF